MFKLYHMLSTTITIFVFFASLTNSNASLHLEQIAKGFERPVWACVPNDINDKIWIIEQTGLVWIIDSKTGNRESKPFLDIRTDVCCKGNEEGLLGLAFAPDFTQSGRYYINFTNKHQQTQIVRFTSENRQTTHLSTAETIMVYPSEFDNHNGGWLGFGPDQMLYISNGDGGSGNDPNKHGQALDTFLAKILRIDVSQPSGYKVPPDNPFIKNPQAKPEIWAYGVRNPWRCSFDRKTGDFWIADVGQNNWEEINHVIFAKGAGANYGWRLREGNHATPQQGTGGPAPSGSIEPVYVYQHGGGHQQGFSVTGGYVYRGPIHELQGRYIFGDYQNPRIWSFIEVNNQVTDFKDHTLELQPKDGQLHSIASFSENQKGDIFIVDHAGTIYQIVEH